MSQHISACPLMNKALQPSIHALINLLIVMKQNQLPQNNNTELFITRSRSTILLSQQIVLLTIIIIN